MEGCVELLGRWSELCYPAYRKQATGDGGNSKGDPTHIEYYLSVVGIRNSAKTLRLTPTLNAHENLALVWG